MNIKLIILLFINLLIFNCNNAIAQSLVNLRSNDKYLTLGSKINSVDISESFIISKNYIKLAKSENNLDELYTGYSYAATYSLGTDKIKYADSLITVAIKTKDNRYIGLAYASLANANLKLFQYSKALENALIAEDYLKNDSSKEFTLESKFTIGRLKYIIGETTEAKEIIKEIYNYYSWKKEKKPLTVVKSSYLSSLISLIRINASLHNYTDNKTLLKDAYEFLNANKDLEFLRAEIINSDGLNYFYQGNYPKSIEKFRESLQSYSASYEAQYEKFYLAMCYWKMSEYEAAYPYFDEIRSSYLKENQISLEFRPMFEFFIDYYNIKGQKDSQLEAVNNLLSYDKNFKKEQADISDKLQKDYDEKRLIEEKIEIEKSRQTERWLFIGVGTLLLISIAGFLYIHIKKNAKIKGDHIFIKPEVLSQTEETIKEKDSPISHDKDREKVPKTIIKNEFEEVKINFEDYHPINKLTVKMILKNLENFEKKNLFLIPDMKLTSVAESLNTNEKYLSKVIKVSTGKNFNNYINDLRFSYLEKQLKENPEFKEKKIKDISKILGFGTPEVFATLFREKYKKTPTEYFSNL